jgi:cytochrome c biogenesis protein CcmG/thiol:disulfide interchange protein DsbE
LRTRPVRWVALGAAVLLALLLGVLATRPSAASRTADSPLLGKRAPPISGTTIDGETTSLLESRGRWVLVNFFATWCIPCRKEHPHLLAFSERHRVAADAAVVGVIYDDSVKAVRDFRADEGGDWPMVTDPKGQIALDFGVAGVPESFLISPDGVVVAKIVGGVRLNDLEELLAQTRAPAGREE